MEADIAANFRAILNNPESGMVLWQNTLQTLLFSYPKTDTVAQGLIEQALAQGILPPSINDPYARGLADYSYATAAIATHQLNPSLSQD